MESFLQTEVFARLGWIKGRLVPSNAPLKGRTVLRIVPKRSVVMPAIGAPIKFASVSDAPASVGLASDT